MKKFKINNCIITADSVSKAVKSKLKSFGLDVVKEGKTWSGREHLEFAIDKSLASVQDVVKIIEQVEAEVEKKFNCPMTFNIGQNSSSVVAVIDIDKQYVKDSVKDDRLSPMTYKKLKEAGYSSDDWKNWTQEEANEKIHSGEKGGKKESKKEEPKKEKNYLGEKEGSVRAAYSSTPNPYAKKNIQEYSTQSTKSSSLSEKQIKKLDNKYQYDLKHGFNITHSNNPKRYIDVKPSEVDAVRDWLSTKGMTKTNVVKEGRYTYLQVDTDEYNEYASRLPANEEKILYLLDNQYLHSSEDSVDKMKNAITEYDDRFVIKNNLLKHKDYFGEEKYDRETEYRAYDFKKYFGDKRVSMDGDTITIFKTSTKDSIKDSNHRFTKDELANIQKLCNSVKAKDVMKKYKVGNRIIACDSPVKAMELAKLIDSMKDADYSYLTEEEEKAVDDYKRAISTTTNPEVLKIFQHILEEELDHIEELKKAEDVDEEQIHDERSGQFTRIIENAIKRGRKISSPYSGYYAIKAKKSDFEQLKKELEAQGYTHVFYESNPYVSYNVFFKN